MAVLAGRAALSLVVAVMALGIGALHGFWSYRPVRQWITSLLGIGAEGLELTRPCTLTEQPVLLCRRCSCCGGRFSRTRSSNSSNSSRARRARSRRCLPARTARRSRMQRQPPRSRRRPPAGAFTSKPPAGRLPASTQPQPMSMPGIQKGFAGLICGSEAWRSSNLRFRDHALVPAGRIERTGTFAVKQPCHMRGSPACNEPRCDVLAGCVACRQPGVARWIRR